jgi:hypothetical protein
MTEAFLIVIRLALVILVGYWAYRLWTGTTSWMSRGVGMFFSVVLVWQIIGGTL